MSRPFLMRADALAASLDAAGRPEAAVADEPAPFTQRRARAWAAGPNLVILCPRFEGVDERVTAGRGLIEVSIGDYVLSGDEVAALAILDACVRLIPGVMGKEEESFESGLLEARATGRGARSRRSAPGRSREDRPWRRAEAEQITRERRPDLPPPRG